MTESSRIEGVTDRTAHCEEILEPDLPIVDAHHHLLIYSEAQLAAMAEDRSAIVPPALARLFGRQKRYLVDELLADVTSGHNIQATVHMEAVTMYRRDGPEHFRSVGETEFVNGVAAIGASGVFGSTRICAAMVGSVDLCLGDLVPEILEAHIRAGGGRFRGVRSRVGYDPHPEVLGGTGHPDAMADPLFRQGFAHLAEFGLSFDAHVLEPQLPKVTELARAFPDTAIILNHVGVPLGAGPYADRRCERFPIWRRNMRDLAACDNVVVKLGGLGVPFCGFPSFLAEPPFTSAQLADEWRPYIVTAIELFGPDRCMFESNWPVDASVGRYGMVWNAFKRLTAGATKDEKRALYRGTATRVYRL